MKILVIDDSKTERLFLRSVLVRLQHDVEVAAGGTEGIQLCESFDPDLILLDVVMPEISGYETARILRASRDEWMPIIFLSGCGDAGSVEQGIDAGGDDYLVKPVDARELLAKIGALP